MANTDVVKKSFDDMASQYEVIMDQELRRFWGFGYREFVEWVVGSITPSEGDVVLDVATGTARIPLDLAARSPSGTRTVGLDITLGMLRRAQQGIGEGGLTERIELVCASGMTMPFQQDRFDRVICGLGTHHMDVPVMLREMRRVLKKGGELVLADVAAPGFWRYRAGRALGKFVAATYFLAQRNVARAWAEADAVSHMYTASGWSSLLQDAGFSRIRISNLPGRRLMPQPLIAKAVL